ncbi:Caleosin-domain-containing protein [Hymenopellis radicata]|nr:Caleosin-domain-containing protein [Hymenopellis radicata]
MAQPSYADVVKNDHGNELRKEREMKKKEERLKALDDASNPTSLQKHIEFWDTDHDGVIWPKDTFIGFYKLGFGLILSFAAALIINGAFSYPTQRGLMPDPFFRIRVDKIQRGKHGSDSGAFDNRGDFIEAKFDRIFREYSSVEDKSGLTRYDTFNFIRGQRCVLDFFGIMAVIFEWVSTWILLNPKDGIIRKEDLYAVYDGTIFEKIARKRGYN